MRQSADRLPAWKYLSRLPESAPFDWATMANRFSQFVMDPSNGVRFTDERGNVAFTAFLEGKTRQKTSHELVSFGPVVLGKALLGHDVTALIPSLKDFYNETAGIYLNRHGENRIEMWYLMYVVSLAAHLIRLICPEDPVFHGQLEKSFETLMTMADVLGYNYYHQGYNFSNNAPWTKRDVYRQPDAIGGYAYLMLMAYEITGKQVYLDEAEGAADRYLAFAKNPWYEVPDVAMALLACARLTSMGKPKDTAKALGFLLDPDGGLVVGNWGPMDVTGLYRGCSASQPESAYSLETFMPLPYILPAVRYQPELASVIGAYALHASAKSRLFFSEYLEGTESRADLTPVVAYERLFEQHEGKYVYAAGDFDGHKSIYGGAFALWWAALTAPSDDPAILKLDLTSSDFLQPGGWPTWLYYNPQDTPRMVTVQPGEGSLYDLELHRKLAENSDFVTADGGIVLKVPSGGTRIVAVVPTNGTSNIDGNALTIDGIAVDFAFPG